MYLTMHAAKKSNTADIYDNSLRDETHEVDSLVRHSDVVPGLPYDIVPNSQDNNTIIEKLMKDNKKSRRQIQDNQPPSPHLLLLESTEHKIFSEVIGLMDEIEALNQTIATHQQSIISLELQKRQILSPTTLAAQLQNENHQLQRSLKTLQMRFSGELQEILQLQTQKYEELKQQLASIHQDNPSTNPSIIQTIQINEDLRMKIRMLTASDKYQLHPGHQHQRLQLQTAFIQEEQKKHAFIKDFDHFNQQYLRLVNECRELEQQFTQQQNKPSARIRNNFKRNQSMEKIPRNVVKKESKQQKYISTSVRNQHHSTTKHLKPFVDLVSQMKNILQR